jgi:tetratricopeptide (TPR) repeat protein
MELAAAATAGGEPILAEQALEAALTTSVPAVEVIQALVPVRLVLGHDELALVDCRRLAALDPNLAAPHAAEARVLRSRREILAATAAYRAALTRAKEVAEAAVLRRELVELLVQQGSVAEARREFDQLPHGQFDNADLALLRAYILRFEGRSREALHDVNDFLAVYPKHADAILLRCTLKFDLADYQSAVADLRLLTEINPFHKEAHYLLGQAYLRLGSAAAAKLHLETSQRLAAALEEIRTLEGQADRDPPNAQVQLRLAELYDSTGQPELAARWRKSAARRNED